MIDYTLCYRRQLQPDATLPIDDEFDLFLTAFSIADRCRHVYERIPAKRKVWVVFPHFELSPDQLPSNEEVFICNEMREDEFIKQLWTQLGSTAGLRICVDITAFVRPHLLFLVRWMFDIGVSTFDAIYVEPRQYAKREQTEFSFEIVDEVRQVAGYEGVHFPDVTNDVLIVAVGYQESLISQVAVNKARARKFQLFGFPPLRADMYQENVLKVSLAQESLGGSSIIDSTNSLFAPANDPFVTAQVLHEKVADLRARGEVSNLYLCPLSTKAQVLGFALYYVTECIGEAVSVIFPFESTYSQRTSYGVERIWKYTIEFPERGL